MSPSPPLQPEPFQPGPSSHLPRVRLGLALTLSALLTLPGAAGHAAEPPAAATALFTEEAAATGLDFVHFNGMSGELYYVENMGSGVGLVDYDLDGDLDVYFLQGHMLGPGKKIEDATFPPKHPLPLTDRLYRNDLTLHPDGSRTLRFTDVTGATGIRATGYGMGLAVGDVDEDGRPDLYVTNFGPNQLWRNRGDGTFEDVTEKSGTGDTRWAIAAIFFDYDRDGWLDLFVANYVDFSFAVHKTCNTASGLRDYCGPLAYDAVPDRLFHNRGDGTFEDVTERSGVSKAFGGGLGVISADFDGDSLPDLYVANDLMENQLWINQGEGKFVDDGLLAGAAVNREGMPEASMGVDAADFDNDGDEDLFMAHIDGETNTLFVNDGKGNFRDQTLQAGLASSSWSATGFGTAFFDYDNDGLLDLLVVNGAVQVLEALARQKDPYPLHQPNLLFHNLGAGRFEDVSAAAGPAFALSEVSRGAAFGDLDNDGDTDVVVSNNAGPARLLINRVGQDRHWVGLRLVEGDPPWDALGARATLERPDGRLYRQRVTTGGSYGSTNDPRVLFGLGDDPAVGAVRVDWPDGTIEEWTEVPVDAYTELRKGTGKAVTTGAPDRPAEPSEEDGTRGTETR